MTYEGGSQDTQSTRSGSTETSLSSNHTSGLPQTLPTVNSEWSAHYDATHGATFYHHEATRRVTWTNPNELSTMMNENPML